MDKKNIKNKYLKKLKLIKDYNKYYYEKSKPLVDDQIYDNLKYEIIELETQLANGTELNFGDAEQVASLQIDYIDSHLSFFNVHLIVFSSLSNAE